MPSPHPIRFVDGKPVPLAVQLAWLHAGAARWRRGFGACYEIRGSFEGDKFRRVSRNGARCAIEAARAIRGAYHLAGMGVPS